MKIKLSIFAAIIVSLFAVLQYSCGKDDLEANEYFDTKINKEQVKNLEPDKINVKRGITSIAGYVNDDDLKVAVVITVQGDKPGKYRQVYDYKTGVSVTECGLTYKVLSRKKASKSSDYFVSYEGAVIIDKIDAEKKTMSGSYEFKVRSIPDKKNEHLINGKFVNLSFK